jgi:hypothetical protein
VTKEKRKLTPKKILIFVCSLLFLRVSLILLHMLVERVSGYVDKIVSAFSKRTRTDQQKSGRTRLVTGWPKDFPSLLIILVQYGGREDILAGISLLLLFSLSILLAYVPSMSLAWFVGTLIVFTNIFFSKLLLLSSSVRIMTKKSLYLKPPSASDFLFSFPLDYFGIVLSFTNFYLFTSSLSNQAFIRTHGLPHPLPFEDCLIYSLSCITTLNLSDILAFTVWAKLLSFAELLVGIFFLVIFGSMIIGLFLTEKVSAEEEEYAKEKKQLLDSLSSALGPWVHKVACLLKDLKLSLEDTPMITKSARPIKTLVVSVAYPQASSDKGLRVALPCSRLNDLVGLLPASIKQRLSDAGVSLGQIIDKIEEGALGQISTVQWTDKKGQEVVLNIAVQEVE